MIRHLAFALVLVAAGSAQAAERKLDRTFTVSPGGTLTVDADGGEVRVTGSDGNQVVVQVVARGPEDDLADIKMDASQNASGVVVTVKQPKRSWLSWSSKEGEENIEVTVPRRYLVNVKTAGGGIELRDTEGAATLNTAGGGIHAKNVTGNIQAKTSGGSIKAESIRGDVDAETSGGEVALLKVDGKIRGRSMGGGVRCSLVGPNRGIYMSTSGGGVEIIVPKGTKGTIDLSTMGGGVHSDITVASTVRKETQLEGTINGGGAEIYGHTMGGGVSLREER